MNPFDLTDKIFGRLLVLRRAPGRADHVSRWVCRCQCGEQEEIAGASLRNGASTQCQKCAEQSAPDYDDGLQPLRGLGVSRFT